MEGFLYKKGHVRRNWKERYFILKPQPPTIFYYEKKPKNVDKAEPLGTIPLHKVCISLSFFFKKSFVLLFLFCL